MQVQKLYLFKCIKKTVNLVGKFATCRLVTFSRLVTHFCFGHSVRRVARGDCANMFYF